MLFCATFGVLILFHGWIRIRKGDRSVKLPLKKFKYCMPSCKSNENFCQIVEFHENEPVQFQWFDEKKIRQKSDKMLMYFSACNLQKSKLKRQKFEDYVELSRFYASVSWLVTIFRWRLISSGSKNSWLWITESNFYKSGRWISWKIKNNWKYVWQETLIKSLENK